MENNMKKLLVVAGLLLGLAAPSHAGTYYDLQQNTSAFMRIGGNIKVADPAAPMTPTITLDGVGGAVSAAAVKITGIASGSQCLQADGSGNVSGTGSACGTNKVSKAGDFMTGQLTIGGSTFTVTGVDGSNDAARFFGGLSLSDGFALHWQASGSKVLGGTSNLVLNSASGANAVQINSGSAGATGTRGLYIYDGNLSPAVKMRFDPTTDSAVSTRLRVGDIASPAATLDVGGDSTQSGAATYASSITVKGNAFSVGGSSFTVGGGSATVAYSITAASFYGNGANLTGISSGYTHQMASATAIAADANVTNTSLGPCVSGTTITFTTGNSITRGIVFFTGDGQNSSANTYLSATAIIDNGDGHGGKFCSNSTSGGGLVRVKTVLAFEPYYTSFACPTELLPNTVYKICLTAAVNSGTGVVLNDANSWAQFFVVEVAP
jgi:hypothetical protein